MTPHICWISNYIGLPHAGAGEDMAVVSKMLRHANLSTTSDIYVHLSNTANRAAANRHAACLAGAGS